MASVVLDPAYRRIDVEEFLAMDFGDAKAELDDGLIYMMAGGSEAHARVAGNIMVFLGSRLRGSGCRAYGSDLAVRTKERSARFPDVSVYCNLTRTPELSGRKLLGDPTVIFEVLSPSTSTNNDQTTKLVEYRERPGVRDIVFVDTQAERVRIVSRDDRGGWADHWLDDATDLHLPSLDLTIPRGEIFADD